MNVTTRSPQRPRNTTARRHRLSEGRCPMHNIHLTQVTPFVYTRNGHMSPRGTYTVAVCPRRDCRCAATMRDWDSPAWLLADDNQKPENRLSQHSGSRLAGN